MITLEDQIKEARRELALRKRVYPKWVRRGDMTEGQATYYITVMETIVATLTRLDVEQRQMSLFGATQ